MTRFPVAAKIAFGCGRADFSGTANACPDAKIRATAAHISCHGGVNFGVGWMGIGFQECCDSHRLPDLTVAALRYIEFLPGLLQWMHGMRIKSFDRGDFFGTDA